MVPDRCGVTYYRYTQVQENTGYEQEDPDQVSEELGKLQQETSGGTRQGAGGPIGQVQKAPGQVREDPGQVQEDLGYVQGNSGWVQETDCVYGGPGLAEGGKEKCKPFCTRFRRRLICRKYKASCRRPQACCKRTPGQVQKDLAGRCYFGSLGLYQQPGEAIKPEYFTFYDFAAQKRVQIKNFVKYFIQMAIL